MNVAHAAMLRRGAERGKHQVLTQGLSVHMEEHLRTQGRKAICATQSRYEFVYGHAEILHSSAARNSSESLSFFRFRTFSND